MLLTNCVGQKVERYVVVILRPKGGFNAKIVAELKMWRHPEYFSFKDTSVVNQLYAVNGMEEPADVLNYMASLGWTMVTSTGLPYGWAYFYFKREFDPSELVTQ